MIEKIIIAGAGGQGIMLLGKVLAEAAMRENKFVTWLPSYGAEVRGGTANCMVVVSDKAISSPFIDKADSLIIMNGPSLQRFKPRLKNNGLLILNSSLAGAALNKKCIKYPFTDIAVKLGNIKIANMVALGCYLGRKNTVTVKTVLKVFADFAPAGQNDIFEINKKALRCGTELK
jgi:2-oxoglutarate ferredoxin oxidoreductase subunit gamma